MVLETNTLSPSVGQDTPVSSCFPLEVRTTSASSWIKDVPERRTDEVRSDTEGCKYLSSGKVVARGRAGDYEPAQTTSTEDWEASGLMHKRLDQIGERRIGEFLQEFYPPHERVAIGIGDDAAAVRLQGSGSNLLVITTDPCPLPAAWLLGDQDYYYLGWYSVLINASDLAAMGAEPMGIVLSVVAQEEMAFSGFRRFLEGTKDAADTFTCPVIGGNLKDGSEFQVVGTAFGVVKESEVLRRRGAQSGDLLVVVGDLGLFWSGLLASLLSLELGELDWREARRNIYRPIARVKEGRIIAQQHLASSCMDNSDGLIACLYQMVSGNPLDFVLDWRDVRRSPIVDEVARITGVAPIELYAGWGDWQLVVTVPPSNIGGLQCSMAGIAPVHVIGEVRSGHGAILDRSGRTVPNKDAERFSKSSYFSHGIEAYMRLLFQNADELIEHMHVQESIHRQSRTEHKSP